MVLKEVLLSKDLHMSCIQLALSTEKMEVIALLLGEIEQIDNEEKIFLYAMKIPHRMDKKKDRVEISPEQMSCAIDYADELKQRTKKDIRVLGWFHSHPHITVWPSHVDIMTQANYQAMCGSFVGLICSVYSDDKVTKEKKISITCFQSEAVSDPSRGVTYGRRAVPFFVGDNPPISYGISCLKAVCDLPNILLQEEDCSYVTSAQQATDTISKIHNEMLLTKAQLHISNNVSFPLLKTLEIREKMLKNQLAVLQKYGDKLKPTCSGVKNADEDIDES